MNEKTGKREVGEERKQSIDFKEAASCPSVVQRDPRKGQQLFRPDPNGVENSNTTLRWLLIGADNSEFVGLVHCHNTRNFRVLFLISSVDI